MTIGERIKQAREAAGMSVYQLSKLVGMHQSTIGNHERGVRNVTLTAVERYAGALGVSPSWLAGWEKKKVKVRRKG